VTSDEKITFILSLAKRIAREHPEFFSNGYSPEVQVLVYALHRLKNELDSRGTQAVEYITVAENGDSNTVRRGFNVTITLMCSKGHRLLVLHPRSSRSLAKLIRELRLLRVTCPVCGSGSIYMKIEGAGKAMASGNGNKSQVKTG
jgi:hypothetical protein